MEEFHTDNTTKLGDALLCMAILLERSATVSPEDKKEVEERLHMYDNLLENSSIIKKIRAESKAQGEARGRTMELHRMVVKMVKVRFPALTELASKRASRISKLDVLDRLVDDLLEAPDEATARASLETTERSMSRSRRS